MSAEQVEKLLLRRNLAWAPILAATHAVRHSLPSHPMPESARRPVKCVIMNGGKKYRFITKGFFKRVGGEEVFDRLDILVAVPLPESVH